MDKHTLPFSRYLLQRLRERPKNEQVAIMRQAEYMRVHYHLGLTSALELMLKLGSYLNGEDK